MNHLDLGWNDESFQKFSTQFDVATRLAYSDLLQETLGGNTNESIVAIRRQAQFAHGADLPLTIEISLGNSPITGEPLSIEFNLIPPGWFLMGAPDSDTRAPADEKPQHWVHIEKPFYASKYEVTQEQYMAVIGTNPSHFVNFENHHLFPVEQVSWDDAQTFCKALTKVLPNKLQRYALAGMDTSRFSVGLPDETEWEYMARAGTTTYFPWGNELNGTQANTDGRYPFGTTEKGPFLGRTCPVGSYKPNNWGLYDVIGNVWEWCENAYDEKAYEKRAALGLKPPAEEYDYTEDVHFEGILSASRGGEDPLF